MIPNGYNITKDYLLKLSGVLVVVRSSFFPTSLTCTVIFIFHFFRVIFNFENKKIKNNSCKYVYNYLIC